ncbi:methyltransferase family protein [Mycobacterium helveticum]|uniref:Isoprenylcysteine carboxylmethyltransferase family protein n=1 Tax=Mycobacterium helveticum TaxID=2592811 RepID=A0A557Y074_9MYCO|nr:isoprenylcysteine carboxylmethyltransferase family protein [Mycobacterium helveticum]TVS88490.1 isoprenylcysteine carboxylmethyltransferase family protein [Mycobacterium helveticum]TVS91949.1 isoprenylcysteine carboxylmethyltransferase family protein [Mycobacterium helveticum]
MKTAVRLTTSSILGLALFGLVLFLPAGTLDYWQAWLFIAVFSVVTTVPTIYLARTNPAALRRRMHAGPWAERRAAQKIIITGSFLAIFATMAFSAFDRRMGWSSVPAAVAVIGDVLVAAGLGIAMLVVVQNGYAAATVTVEARQTLVTGGLYGLVRHPMYAGDVVMMVGMPLALGSYWGLVFVIPGVAMLVFRILDEEKLLIAELAGYREYSRDVRYRLLPHVW